MYTSLVVMAAGLGSRFGQGIKQLTPVGPNGEIIIDYSVHDAVEAGFNKIIFVIRKDLEADFREIIGDRLATTCDCEIAYAYQNIEDIPEGCTVPEGRKKPWGTGHAILACKGLIHEPFAIINADDYYGKTAFVKLHDYLVAHGNEPYHYCMAGFILENTLSENGTVTRGICTVDDNANLVTVQETAGIIRTADGAQSENGSVDPQSYVSMNMWGITPEFLDTLESEFAAFFANLTDDTALKAEFLLPMVVDSLVQQKRATVAVLETTDRWFGVTYAEDRPVVQAAFRKLVADGVYPSPLR